MYKMFNPNGRQWTDKIARAGVFPTMCHRRS